MALTTDIRNKDQIRTYNRADSVVFLKTREAFGGLSNMAGGFSLCVNGIDIRTSEALYQACRFPHLPAVQRLIIEQRSPMTAKMKSRKHHQNSRQDWDWVRVKIMRWCLRVKLIQNWDAFSELLLETGDQPIVEQSHKDDFWGAKPVDTRTLVGVNALGRLLMELREEVKTEGQEAFLQVEPLDILDFLFNGRPIEPVTAPSRRAVAASAETSEPLSYAVQPSLFESSVVKEPSPPEYAAEISKNTGITYFEPYPAYKGSGIDWLGKIPAHWEVHKSKNLWREIEERSEFGNEQLLAVSQYSGITPREEDSRSESLVAYKKCQPNDLVINIMLAWLGGLGVTKQDGIVSPAYCVYRQTQDNDPSYLGYLYRTPIYLAEFARRSTGIVPSRWRMYTEDFGQVLTILPPKSEQKRIVRLLDQKIAEIDEAIDKKQRLIELLKELKAIMINQAVTKGLNPNVPMRDSGVEWIGEIPVHWEVYKSKNLWREIEERSEFGNEQLLAVSQYSGITPREEDSRSASLVAYKKCQTNDLVINIMLAWLGGLGVTKQDGIVSPAYCVYRQTQNNDPSYLGYLYRTPIYLAEFARRSTGIVPSRWRMYTEDFGQVLTILPPKSEQKRIVRFLDQKTAEIDEAIDKNQRLIELLKELKQVTIAEAVTGKIKV